MINLLYVLSSWIMAVEISFIKLLKWRNIFNILRAFGKLRKKTTNSFVMSHCPSVRTEQSGCHWADFHVKWYLSIFKKKTVEKYKFH